MKQFTKGHDPRRNTKGRKKGIPNKSTEALRAVIRQFIEDNIESIQKDYDDLKPPERLNFLNSLLRHVLPEPVTVERLTENQLNQLYDYVLIRYGSEKQS